MQSHGNDQSSQEVINCNKRLAVIYSERAEIHFKEKKYNDALLDCSKAIELDPTVGMYYNNRAMAYMKLNMPDEAINDYTQAIKVDSGLIIYGNRGLAYYRKKQYEAAIKDLSECLELTQNTITRKNCFINRGCSFYYLKKYEKAISDFNMALKINPKECDSYNNLAKCHYKLGNWNKAIHYYTKALEINSQELLPYEGLIKILGNKKNKDYFHRIEQPALFSAIIKLSKDDQIKFLNQCLDEHTLLGAYMHSEMGGNTLKVICNHLKKLDHDSVTPIRKSISNSNLSYFSSTMQKGEKHQPEIAEKDMKHTTKV